MIVETFCLCWVRSFKQILIQLLDFPIGKAWARYMPNVSLFGISLNPGPFTIKEHVIITTAAAASSEPVYAVSVEFAKIMSMLSPHFLRHF
jgi:hypothetical protein